MSDRTFGRTIWNLFLALLNATLILLALCLWLALGVSSNLRSLMADFAQNLIDLTPVTEDVRGLRDEVAGLRADLAAIGTPDSPLAQTTLSRVLDVTTSIDNRIEEMQTQFDLALQNPEQLIGTAVDQTFEAVAENVSELRQCTPTDPTGASG